MSIHIRYYGSIPCNFVGISMSYLSWAHSGSNQFSICSINISNICRCHCFSFCFTNDEHAALCATCYTHKSSFEFWSINVLLLILNKQFDCYFWFSFYLLDVTLLSSPTRCFRICVGISLSFCPKVKPPNMHIVSKHHSHHSDYLRIFSTATSKLFM